VYYSSTHDRNAPGATKMGRVTVKQWAAAAEAASGYRDWDEFCQGARWPHAFVLFTSLVISSSPVVETLAGREGTSLIQVEPLTW